MAAVKERWRWQVAVVLFALAFWTNPGRNEETFRQHLRDQRTIALTQRIAESLGLVNLKVWSLLVVSIGREGSRWFVGAFDRWIELPSSLSGAWLAQPGLWPEARDPDALLVSFLVLFVLWQAAPRFMLRHCTASLCNLHAGRVWSLLTAQLSHSQPEHLLVNALFLYSTAPGVHAWLGRSRFCGLFFGGGAAALAASLYLSPRLLKGRPYVECVGASGSLFALLGYLAHTSSRVRWLGRDWSSAEFALAQLLLSGGVGALGAADGAAAGAQKDLIAHIAGAAVGWAAAEFNLL